MRRRLPLLLLCALAACRPDAAPADTTSVDGPVAGPVGADVAADIDSVNGGLSFPHGPYHYACTGGRSFEALFPTPDSVRVTLEGGQTLTLGAAISADGARYSDGITTAWFKGMHDGFIMEHDSTTYADCRTAE
jgi:membrane-bound inhibitor of C-type lysozyme